MCVQIWAARRQPQERDTRGPLVDNPASDDDPPVRRRARHVLRSAARLLRDVRAHRGVVLSILREAKTDQDRF
ncbi:MAG TPA: hypothetical protein VGM06_20645 [Polyangiaceae bacterium]